MKTPQIASTDEAWDEKLLGSDAAFASRAELSSEQSGSFDDSLGLQMISLRLQRTLIEDFKMIATAHGIGYQPLMRQVLKRFADCEKRRLLKDALAQSVPLDFLDDSAEANEDQTPPKRKAA